MISWDQLLQGFHEPIPGDTGLQSLVSLLDSGRIKPMKILLIILCLLLPPLAVYLKTNDVKTTLINLVLSFLFFVPGVIHALWVVLK